MNYKPNEINWKVGDVVIHDADAKEKHMLMTVIENRGNKIATVYLYPKAGGSIKVYENPKCFLHDPSIFGIDTTIQQKPVHDIPFTPVMVDAFEKRYPRGRKVEIWEAFRYGWVAALIWDKSRGASCADPVSVQPTAANGGTIAEAK